MYNLSCSLMAWRKLKFRIIFILVLMGLSGTTTAEMIDWPIVKSAEAEKLMNGTISLTSTGGKIPIFIPSDVFRTKQVCNSCVWDLYLRTKDGNLHKSNTISGYYVVSNKKPTMWGNVDDQIDGAISSINSGSNWPSLSLAQVSESCLSIFPMDSNENPIIPPGLSIDSVCTRITQVNQDKSCHFSIDNVNFDFGEFGKGTVAGKNLTKKIQLSCTSDVDITLNSVSVGGVTALSNGMNATLKINNKNPGEIIHGKSGAQYITLEETLTGVPDSVGSFTGNNVLRIEYQ